MQWHTGDRVVQTWAGKHSQHDCGCLVKSVSHLSGILALVHLMIDDENGV